MLDAGGSSIGATARIFNYCDQTAKFLEISHFLAENYRRQLRLKNSSRSKLLTHAVTVHLTAVEVPSAGISLNALYSALCHVLRERGLGSSDFWILSEKVVRNRLSGGGLGNRPLSFYTPLAGGKLRQVVNSVERRRMIFPMIIDEVQSATLLTLINSNSFLIANLNWEKNYEIKHVKKTMTKCLDIGRHQNSVFFQQKYQLSLVCYSL